MLDIPLLLRCLRTARSQGTPFPFGLIRYALRHLFRLITWMLQATARSIAERASLLTLRCSTPSAPC